MTHTPVSGAPSPLADPAAEAGSQPLAAARLTRGVRRALAALGHASLTEVPLANGRRADVLAVDGTGAFTVVEVKSSTQDFRADGKWPDYRPFCDRFYFAVSEAFPVELIPDTCGLLVADAYGAAELRPAPEHRLDAARRKAMLIRFCLAGGGRLHRLEDPGA